MTKCQAKKVLVFGTFDIFHKGHESFLRQAKKAGVFLTVVVARNKTVKKVKSRLPKNPEKVRLKNVAGSGIADEVIMGGLDDKYEIIKKTKPDVICLGYDQVAFVCGLEDKLVAYGLKDVKIKRLKPYKPEIYKSSLIHKSCDI